MSDNKLTPAETYREIAAPSGVVPDGVYDDRQRGLRVMYKRGKESIINDTGGVIAGYLPFGHYPDVPRPCGGRAICPNGDAVGHAVAQAMNNLEKE